MQAPRSGFVPLRGASGHLLGYLHPERMVLRLKRKGETTEEIDLTSYLSRAEH